MIRTLMMVWMLASLTVPSLLAKRNDDVVVMKNGDRLTGEIKKLEKGQLFFKAPYMLDPVALDWNLVDRIESKDNFNVSLTTGEIHTGGIGKDTEQQNGTPDFFVSEGGNSVRVGRRTVYAVTPVENSMWKQLTGSLDYGYSYTGGNNSTTQSSVSGTVGYRAQRWRLDVQGSSVFNAQSEGTTTGRNTVSALYTKNLTQNWYVGALTELLNSRQQDLTLRTTVGGGLGRVLFRTDRTSVALLSGLLYSRERYQGTDGGTEPRANNAEWLFYLKYNTYRFKTLNVDSVAYVYPSLTETGRVRMGVEPALKVEIFRNFYWRFSLYENFDNHPPVRAPKNDFGTSTSVGWTF